MSYRIAVGPQQGRKAFMIRTIRPLDRPDPGLERVAKANGFSLHAGVSCEGHQKEKVRAGKALYTLKTPYRDGATQVAFDGKVGKGSESVFQGVAMVEEMLADNASRSLHTR